MQNNSLNEDYRSLNLLHLSMVFGLLIMSLVVYYITRGDIVGLVNAVGPWETLVFAVVAISLVLVYYFNRKRIPAIRQIADKRAKWESYRKLEVQKYALIEGSAFLCLVVFMLRGNLYFLLFTLVLAMLLYYMRPRQKRLVNELGFEEPDFT